jgi:hypothetical protein
MGYMSGNLENTPRKRKETRSRDVVNAKDSTKLSKLIRKLAQADRLYYQSRPAIGLVATSRPNKVSSLMTLETMLAMHRT